MPSYDFGCRECELRWEIIQSMSAISEHVETCPSCGNQAEQIIGRPAMIRVRSGTAPTRIGNDYKRTMTAQDKGFMNEFESLWKQDGMVSPATGERYEMLDDEGGAGPYAGLPSEKEEFRKAREQVDKSGTMPSRKAQQAMKEGHVNQMLGLARDRLRQWPASRKGKKS